MRALGGISFVFFTLVWSALVIFFDTRIAPNTIKQIQSHNYAAIDGRIVESRVRSQPGARRDRDDLQAR